MATTPLYRPTWAEVDLGKLQANLRRLRARIGAGPRVLLVVKADGYGHGAVQVARAAESSGLARYFGVSSVEEGIALRRGRIRSPILILGSLYPFESTLAAIRHRLTPTVASLDGARLIAEAARRAKAALSCHLKIDTGMGRIGVRWPAGRQVVEFLRSAPGVRLEGLYTHLARAEDGPAFTREQLKRFRAAVADIERSGLKAPLRHAANSAGALLYPESRWDMVRPGIAAYGVWPGFEPVLGLKTRLVFLKNVRRGTPIGYGAAFRARRPSRVATIPVGYGDGLPRLLWTSGGRSAGVLVRGRRCPIVGMISMDMTMVDVTGVPGARVGEEAVLLGRQGSETIGAQELARIARTIPYEILTGLKTRVPRVYVDAR